MMGRLIENYLKPHLKLLLTGFLFMARHCHDRRAGRFNAADYR